jgi:hypothetical protein
MKKKIDNFVNKTEEPYIKVEEVSYCEIDKIYNKYAKAIFDLNNKQREDILKVLELSWKANAAHGKIRQWLRLCVGVAKLLKIEKSELINKGEVVDIIVRLSRWAHSSRFYEEFVPFAKNIVSKIWGSIENLYYKK